jgi:hypothetical protein
VRIGYKLFAEVFSPQELVAQAVRAEEAGFDFVEISNHYLRYHPAIVAQAAATTVLLCDGRFTLGVGAGERLNEHVVGRGWPAAGVRHEMLREALGHGRGRGRRVGARPDPVRPMGWKVQSELPNPVNFEAATALVTPDDVRGVAACGPDPRRHLKVARQFVDAGFDHLALLNVPTPTASSSSSPATSPSPSGPSTAPSPGGPPAGAPDRRTPSAPARPAPGSGPRPAGPARPRPGWPGPGRRPPGRRCGRPG